MSIRYLVPRLLVAVLAIALMATFIPTYTFAGSKLVSCSTFDAVFIDDKMTAGGAAFRDDVCFARTPSECRIPDSRIFYVYEAYPNPSDGGICRDQNDRDALVVGGTDQSLLPLPQEIPDASSVQYINFGPTYDDDTIACGGMEIVSPTRGDQISEGENEFTWQPPTNDGQVVTQDDGSTQVRRRQYDIVLTNDITGAVIAETTTNQPPTVTLDVPAGGPYRWRIATESYLEMPDGTTVDELGTNCVFYSGPFMAEAVVTMMDTSGGTSNVGDGFTVNRCEGLRPTSPTSVAYGPTTFYWNAPNDPSLLTAYEVRVYDPFTSGLIGSQRVENPTATNLTMDLGTLMYAYNNITPLSAITWELVAYNGSSTACVLPMEGLTGNNVDFRDSPFDVISPGSPSTEEPPTGGDTPPVEEGPPSGGYTPPVEEGPPPTDGGSGGGGGEPPNCELFPEDC